MKIYRSKVRNASFLLIQIPNEIYLVEVCKLAVRLLVELSRRVKNFTVTSWSSFANAISTTPNKIRRRSKITTVAGKTKNCDLFSGLRQLYLHAYAKKTNFLPNKVISEKLCPYIELWVAMISCEVLHKACKPLIQPKMCPPFLTKKCSIKQEL